MRRLLLFVLGWTLASAAHAWSESGHRITGLIAERLLSTDAAAGVRALTGGTDLAALAVYLDRYKVSLAQRVPRSRAWHYDNRPVCRAAAKRSTYCPDGDCASVQIERQQRVLADRAATVDERRFALLVLLHLVGDIHQPLHAADHDDRGGNAVPVRLPGRSGRAINDDLHAAWDSHLLVVAFEDERDERRIATRLLGGRSARAAEISALQQGTPADWIGESYRIAQTTAYGQLPGFRCPASDPPGEPIDLPPAYVDAARTLIPQRLLAAGARIAAVLDQAFATGPR